MPSKQFDKVMSGQMRMPLSALALDIWGADVEDSPLVFETGDQDGVCVPHSRGLISTHLGEDEIHMIPLSMEMETGEPSPVDARQILLQAIDRAKAEGLNAVAAFEMEFYLFDPNKTKPAPPSSPATNEGLIGEAILSLGELQDFGGFFDDLYANAKRQDIGVDAAIGEAGRGQFEINLLHRDPLNMADDAVLFKELVKNTAQAHGLVASFMPKPYMDAAGSGMHVHISLIDQAGRNIFDNGTDDGTQELTFAVSGLLASMKEASLIWAPHKNSYRRLQPGAHAPTAICWAHENRTAAIRIPGGDPKAKRIEHRIAGADANPYLVLATILHGILDGLEAKLASAEPITGDAYTQDLPQLPSLWVDAIRDFESSKFIAKNFPNLFQDIFAKMKWQEYRGFEAEISQKEISSYLRGL